MKEEISHSKHKKERRSRAVTNQGEGEKRRRLKWPTGCQVTQKGVRKADEVAERAAKRREEGNLGQYHKSKCITGSSLLQLYAINELENPMSFALLRYLQFNI